MNEARASAPSAATLRAILLMIGAMASFTFADTAIKLASARLPTGQILATVGCVGFLAFTAWTTHSGQPLLNRRFFHPAVLVRNTAEVVGTIGFITAISKVPLSLAISIQQATPLAITVGAALVLRERVGPWRWSAVGVGFIGVLLILRPGLEGFDTGALWALLAVLGLSIRDLSTRFLPPGTGTPLLAAYAFGALMPTGLLMLVLSGGEVAPNPIEWLWLAGAALGSMIAYVMITASLRVGEVSAVAPYRYSRILFVMLVAVLFLGETVDTLALLGTSMIVGAGLTVLWRETRSR